MITGIFPMGCRDAERPEIPDPAELFKRLD